MPEPSHLTAVPSPRTSSAPLPAETAPTPQDAPDLLAALDAGDEAAVHAWVRAHVPDPTSLALYATLLGLGLAGLMEWPAVAFAALAQVVVDQRLGGIENVVRELRAIVDGRPRTA